jgi:hypothetical protein
MTPVLFAVEGETDVPVAEKLIELVGRVPRRVSASGGSSSIDAGLTRWARPSNGEPMLVLRDWDVADNVECAPELRARIAGARCPSNVAVRIVVRSMESWLMADRDAACHYFRTTKIPIHPEQVEHPKLALVDACRRSKLRRVRDGMIPRPGSGGAVGADFSLLIADFARNHWNPTRARLNAPSLSRAIGRMEQLIADNIW